MGEIRFDRVEIRAERTPEGYIVDDPILTRTGVFEYRNPNGSVRREYRPPEAVFAVDSLSAYEGLPITDGHPGKVTAANVKRHLAGTVMSAGRQDGESIRAKVKIFDIKPVEEGKKELSVGYEVEIDPTPGISPEGERYDVKQISVKPNHLALCRKGRAGTARLNLDAADDADEPEKEDTMSLVKVAVASGLSYDAAPEVAQYAQELKTRLDAVTAERDAAAARADSAEAKTKELETGAEKVRQDARDEALARVKLEATLTAAKVQFKADATDLELQTAFIKSVRGDSLDLTGKSEAYIQAAYDMALADAQKAAKSVPDQRRAMNQDSRDPEKKAAPASAAEARRQMIANQTGQQAA
jgi:hypothetical protein